MLIQTDGQKYVIGYATLGGIEGGVEYSGDVPEDFAENCRYYKFENGTLIFDAGKKATEEQHIQAAERISELKGLLAATDYIAAKISEGAATREEYADKLMERQNWRDEINKLESL